MARDLFGLLFIPNLRREICPSRRRGALFPSVKSHWLFGNLPTISTLENAAVLAVDRRVDSRLRREEPGLPGTNLNNFKDSIPHRKSSLLNFNLFTVIEASSGLYATP